ncbi:MAG TPA: hypothetical protein VFG12_00790 [Rhodopila sp.]|nr:hypothetical protein [Rhodopila sp.]
MQEAFVYLPTLALFSFVIVASALMRHEMLLLACIPAVFLALITGFVMAIYAGGTFGLFPTGAALLLGAPPAWLLARRLQPRDLLIAIYIAWTTALVLSLVAFGYPDNV